ncbi:MAG: DUF3108 domain-containing protein [Acetobacteraceae bacterium]|nr:DUF3108 domain-containing protein [Acetobacteraceae bacterium]
MPRVLALLFLTIPGLASAEAWRATYTVTAAGVPVLDSIVTLQFEGDAYRVESLNRSRGLASWIVSLRNTTRSDGVFDGDRPRPRQFSLDGVVRGRPRHVLVEYGRDGNPVVRRAEPPSREERHPVSEAETRGTVDQLSAIAMLVRVTARTGRCDGQVRVFDARQVTDFRSSSAGIERFQDGQALRCQVETRILAGARLDRDPVEAARPQPVTAWIASPGPGLPPLPLRIELTSRWWGGVTATLSGVERMP